jgi:hypothetical protein
MAPFWEHAWKGRFDFELRDLMAFVGDTLRIDEKRLEKGILWLEFEWPLSEGRACPLQAAYPDSYPYVRPQVMLRGDPEAFPKRHCSPSDGTLCLLGRDTGLWSAKWTLAELLNRQLEKALSGSAQEDPQGEPMEVWWNSFAPSFPGYIDGSYMLVDTAWDLRDVGEGSLRASYVVDRDGDKIRFRGAVDEIKAKDGTILATREFPLPPDLEACKASMTFPWRRVGRFAPPPPENWQAREVQDQISFGMHPVTHASPAISISVTVQATELGHTVNGDTFLFPLLFGPAKSFRPPKAGHKVTRPSTAIIPTYRAGLGDIGARVPSVEVLRNRTVALFGLGAIGAPIALELARNGCSHLVTVDHDVVEPGNSIRWPLGTTAWGVRKTNAISRHIEAEYPWTAVEPVHRFVGMIAAPDGSEGDHSVLSSIVSGADIVIDATASTGISRLLADYCKRAEKTLVSAFGTSSLKGGIVALYQPKSGCPTCREFAYKKGLIPKAPGSGDTTGLHQPPGCAELTFTGASFDLQELSLEAVRMTVEALSRPEDFNESIIHTLSLHDGKKRIPPTWRVDELPPMTECGCNT